MSGMWVVVEWNQASHRPRLAVDEVFDSQGEAEDLAAELRAAQAKVGRREQYSVHELSDVEGSDE